MDDFGGRSSVALVRRRPRGYVGRDHETIGSDIASVFKILKLPEQVLGAEEAQKLSAIDPGAWYPIEWLLDLMDRLDKELGQYGLLRMGRTLFDFSHKERVLKVARCAKDIVYGIDGMYHHANRGKAIGGWKVLLFEPGHAELRKDDATPLRDGARDPGRGAGRRRCPGVITQRQCFRQGAEVCVFEVSSSLVDERWSSDPPT